MTDMKCKTCGYTWKPRVALPKKCAKCQRWITHGKLYVFKNSVPAKNK